MALLTAFLSRLIPLVPGCPDPTAQLSLLDAAIEFCEETSIVRVTSDPQNIVAGTSRYDLDLPSGTEAVVTQKVWVQTTPCHPAAATMVDTVFAFADTLPAQEPAVGTPSVYFEDLPGVIHLYPVPDKDMELALTARVSIKPTRAATAVPDILFSSWVDAIVNGAAARLSAIPDQPYTSDQRAAGYTARFRHFINRARIEASYGRVKVGVAVRANPLR